MSALPIKRIILYKHGVGYFERRGPLSGESLRLSFPREAMDDVLKSLVALDLGAGQVLGVDFETPEDRASLLARGSIHLSDEHSLLDLVRDLRGRRVRCHTAERPAAKEKRPGFGIGGPAAPGEGEEEPEGLITGTVVGVEFEAEEALVRATMVIYQPERRMIRGLALSAIRRLEILDDGAAADLDYFLRAAQSEEDRRSATLHLSPGDHDLLVGYIAPAPSWRVSYRLLFEEGDPPSVLIQGWGLFDNQLEEDLEGVELALMAGMPVSFRYRLYEPKTPERPLVEDEERTVDGPIFFEGAMAPPPMPQAAPASFAMDDALVMGGAPAPKLARASIAQLSESVTAVASGEDRGALFAYRVGHPVSVARGQSAMVPIISARIDGRRELLYKGAKQPVNPVASLRMSNATGLTLERGPVTVLENGDYAGEAVVPFTRSGAELIVPYAVELGVKVSEHVNTFRTLAGVRVRDEYLLVDEFDTTRREYRITSSLDRPAEVVIEHPRAAGAELVETRAPDEQGAEFLRWSVGCEPNSLTSFVVQERRATSRNERVRGLTGKALERYLRGRHLDQATFDALSGVLELYGQADAARAESDRLTKQRDAIYRQQKQIQGNLGPLGREGEEKALRQRYVAELNELEDRLKAIAADEERLRQRIEGLEADAAARLRALSQSKS